MKYSLSGPGGQLDGLTAAVELVTGDSVRRYTAGSLPPGLSLTVTAEPAPDGGTLVRSVLRNGSAAPVVVRRIFPLMYGAGASLRLSAPPQGRWSVWKQGWQSWSYAGPRPLTGHDVNPRSALTRGAHADPHWPVPVVPGRFLSESMIMLGCPEGGAVLLAGFVSGARMFGRFDLTSGSPLGWLEAWCEADGYSLAPGETLEAEPLLVVLAPEQVALDTYVAAVRGAMAPRVPARSPSVWCSWYYYFTRVAEKDILNAARGLAGQPIDVIQLDDGYQTAVGDWLSLNARFPHGLAWLAEQVRTEGYTPGIWLAPFVALRRSKLFREHPGWFVKGPNGRPVRAGWNPGWRDVYYALDTTHPEVEAWLTSLVQTLVGWGYRYLKLDFLYGAAAAGARYDAQVTRAGALRRGLEIIRKAAGDEVFLLGCGSPMMPAVGLVDAMRVGPDVAPDWRFKFFGLPILGREPGVASARNALVTAMGRQWMHGRFWINDSDSAILRDRESHLTAEEARLVATVGGLSGGVFSFSDPPSALSPERRGWLRRLLPVVRTGFEPVSYLEEPIPTLSVARDGDWLVLLAANGNHRGRTLEVKFAQLGLPARCHVYDAWADRYAGCFEGGFSDGIDIPAHGCRVLILRAAGPAPAVVGTTLHLSPGQSIASTHWDGATLTVRLHPDAASGERQATITVAHPPGGAHGPVIIEGATAGTTRVGAKGELVVSIK